MTNAAMKALDQLWQASTGSATEDLAEGTRLWHCGRIATTAHIDADRALWTTREASRADDYVGWAKEPASWTSIAATRLELAVTQPLRAADFAAHSLMKFTVEHCGSRHDQMKRTLRAWLVEHGLQAAVALNSDPNEVVIVFPARDLTIVAASAL